MVSHNLGLPDQKALEHLVFGTLPDRPLGNVQLPSQEVRVPFELFRCRLSLPVQDDVLQHGGEVGSDMFIDGLSVAVEEQ
jgi:hypothetical protein